MLKGDITVMPTLPSIYYAPIVNNPFSDTLNKLKCLQ